MTRLFVGTQPPQQGIGRTIIVDSGVYHQLESKADLTRFPTPFLFDDFKLFLAVCCY
jgi:hypothetical protein